MVIITHCGLVLPVRGGFGSASEIFWASMYVEAKPVAFPSNGPMVIGLEVVLSCPVSLPVPAQVPEKNCGTLR